MKLTPLADVEPRARRLAVGMFDGVHLGHREVIRGADSVLTFDPHPDSVVAPAHGLKLLTSLDYKARLIAELGVQELIVISFDREFAAREAECFIDDVLVGALDATSVAVGENFRFGRGARGDAGLLAADPRFTTRAAPLVEVDGEVVSSSHIRDLVLAGEVQDAAHFLGRPFRLRGPVVHGEKRGRELGFPTANLVPDEQLVCPGYGVYAALANGQPAAVSIGVRPTFGSGQGELVEVYILDFSGELYGEQLDVDFLARLRGERRFDSVDALVAQMAIDVEDARAIAARVAG